MVKPTSMNEIRKRANDFARDWKDNPGDERQDAQTFVRALFAVYGITERRAAYFERRVKRSSTGRQGYIDALVPGQLLVEMKSAGKDLAEAEDQALDYIAGLSGAETPRCILTCDFRKFRLYDPLAPAGEQVVEWPLADFGMFADKLAFLAGYRVDEPTAAEQEAASIKAAKIMGRLYEELDGSVFDDHQASVFLVRALFCLFADDSGLFDRDLFFTFLLDRTSEDGADLGALLTQLFQTLATARERRGDRLDELLAQFPYVNGDVFDDPLPIPSFNASMREQLLEASTFNWSQISPAVFGSLFQAVKSKEARRTLGEHYTTERNIMRLIGPMFLDDLHNRFDAARSDAAGLRALRRDMGAMRFLDPACGCGNFLVVAYREMRALDLAILVRLQELQAVGAGGRTSSTTFAPTLMFDVDDLPVRLEHFHGIEIEEWPARIAATALHLVEHQANLAMEKALGQAPETLPLNKVKSITVANALRLDWTTVVAPTEHLYVLGNPPFIGISLRSPEQVADLEAVWGGGYHGSLDYVTGWYAKALALFTRPGYSGEFSFVSTNSITQGEPVPNLFMPIFGEGWRIKFAHRTFAWTSEAPGAAAVHCVILGFDTRPRSAAHLFDYSDNIKGDGGEVPVRERINAYLIDGANVLVEARTVPLASRWPEVRYGNKPTDDGNFIVEPDQYAEVAADPVAAKYLRKFIGARELLHGEDRWCLWLADLNPADLSRSPILKARVEGVRDFRAKSKAASTREAARTPHLFRQIAPVTGNYICIPRHVSETRAFFTVAHCEPAVVASDATFIADDPDGFAFAMISSSAFITWQRAVGGRIKSDLRFNKLLTWNTFPMPAVTSEQRAAIIAGGQAVLDARALHPERSLADHYNPLAMAPELLRAHATLDRAVDAVFGLKGSVSNDDRLRALFASYQRMTAEATLPLPKPHRR
jgi:hypothetical protein